MTNWNRAFWIMFLIMGILVIAGALLSVIFLEILLGIFVISIGLLKLIASLFTRDERGVAVGIYFSGISIGRTTGLALTNSLVLPTVGSWELVFISYSLEKSSNLDLYGL